MRTSKRISGNSSLMPFGFRPYPVILIFILFALLGAVVAPRLSLKLYPSQTGEQLFINFYMYGAKPELVEMLATSRIESSISLIEGVKSIKSTSGEGWGEIDIEIAKNYDIENIRAKIVASIREIYPKLPHNISYPEVSEVSESESYKKRLLVYTLSGNLPSWQIKQLATNNLIPSIIGIDGVAEANIQGATELDWQIWLNHAAMEQFGISPSAVAKALKPYTLWEGVGETSLNNYSSHEVSITGPGLNRENLGSIPICMVNGRLIHLGQIARIGQRQRDADVAFRINGQPAVYLIISSTPSANQIVLADKIFETIKQKKEELPGIHFGKTYDATDQLRSDLNKNLIRTATSLGILLLFVLLTYRSFRYLWVVGFALTVNILLAAFLYFLLKIEIHLFSLSGFTLSLGLIIDNTLVTLDHLRAKGNMKIFTSLLAATLTTIAALASIFFMQSEQATNLVDFAWVIIINLVISLLVALFLIPALHKKTTGTENKKPKYAHLRTWVKIATGYKSFSLFASKNKRWGIVLGVLIIGIPTFLLPIKIESESFWANLYNKTIGSNTYQYEIKPITDKILGGTLRLFYNSSWANHSWSIPERTKLNVVFKMPDGATLQQADEVAKIFESHILSFEGVENLVTNVNRSRGTLTIYFDKQAESTPLPYELKAYLERLSITQAAADFYIYGVGLGFSNSTSTNFANSIITLKGYSHKALMSWALQFADSIAKNPRVNKVWITGGERWLFTDELKHYSNFDTEKLLSRNINPQSIFSKLSNYTKSNAWHGWIPIENHVKRMEISSDIELLSDFEINQLVMNLDSSGVRVGDVSTFHTRFVRDNIYREDQQYIITLAYNLIGPDKLIEKTLKKQIEKINSVLPQGFLAKAPYVNWSTEKDLWSYYLIFLMLLLIFIISAALFESLVQPLTVISIIPLSFAGVFLTYWIFELPFDQGTIASFLLLGGLVVNSAIYILNEMNHLNKNAEAPLRNYFKALRYKLTPILLTILSTVLGLLPFVIFGEEPFWYSLALGTIGGLIFSIPVILIFLPALPGVLKQNRKQH
ncbi:efflux RND transporter permease subunit [Tenuifilum thalassicum]|uniref:Efflux RND transporter permease subunit n=1 Tax=Tenuifilum thalassicum TaxID=2590900 RepID=A0A7D3XCN8_9BACT|nr:efflux RND transporter permease subunit [Tenuifilum thalassicum]QKG79192.1 efflux RND transporter permease subunit [Tenuifilum thalassicum]